MHSASISSHPHALLVKLLLFSLLITSPTLTGCNTSSGNLNLSAADATDSSNGLTIRQEQDNYALTAQYLPISYQQQTTTGQPVNQAHKLGARIAVFKLRIQSRDSHHSVRNLLQESAGAFAQNQWQSQLFHHMDEAGYLQVNGQQIRPVSAFVEMTPQQDNYLDIIFTFSLPVSFTQDDATVELVLDQAFFLSRPMRFGFEANNLLAIAS